MSTKKQALEKKSKRLQGNVKGRPIALNGVADPFYFNTKGDDGISKDPSLAIFPILRQYPDKTLELVGTGFFVATNGIFITARHVLETILNDKGKQAFGLGILQFLGDDNYLQRPIKQVVWSDSVDIAIGICAEMKSPTRGILRNPIVSITTKDVEVDAPIFTYAYPDTSIGFAKKRQSIHINPHFYQGSIVEHFPERRDSAVITWPCYQTSMHIHGGASGGPVFGPNGKAFGINTSSLDPDTGTSYVTKINAALSLALTNLIIPPAKEPTPISLQELGRLGFAFIDT